MKDRIDKLLVALGYFESREKAKQNILAGKVIVNNFVVDKPGFIISEADRIEIKKDALPYVSRGGLKLEKAILNWNIDLTDKVCMDIGASTGGFTDVMLKNNAKKVYAVDVGYGQLDWKLRNNDKVVNFERTNIRYLEKDKILEYVDFFSIDVSFISLRLVLPKLIEFAQEFCCVALIKPQFEVGRSEVGKNGVVRSKESHKKAIQSVLEYIEQNNLYASDLDFSPIRGPKGNIEFLIYISNIKIKNKILNVDEIIENAHVFFND